MSKITIEIDLATFDKAQSEKLQAMLVGLNYGGAVSPNLPKDKKTPQADKAETKVVEIANETSKAETTEKEVAPKTTLPEIRNMMATKVEKNRDAIKAKMTECGTGNISNLKPEFYDEFFAFLQKLS